MNFEHKDALGRTLNIGDCVAYPVSNRLIIGSIVKLHKRMVRVSQLGIKSTLDNNKFPFDVVLVNESDVTFYLLKQASK